MVEKRFGERLGAALIYGMNIGNYCERNARRSAGGVQVNLFVRPTHRSLGGECYNFHMPVDRGDLEWCLAVIVLLVGIDIVPCEEQFHHALMPTVRSNPERCSAIVVGLVGIDIIPCKQ